MKRLRQFASKNGHVRRTGACLANVRFGSKAYMRPALVDVCFGQKADMLTILLQTGPLIDRG
jgi:hypothetical protein